MASIPRRVPRPRTEVGRDAVGAVVLAVGVAAVAMVDGGVADLGEPGFLGALIACAALAWRRAVPNTVLGIAVVAFVGTTAMGGTTSLAFVPMVVATYTAVAYASSLAIAVSSAVASVLVASLTVVVVVDSADSALALSAGAWIAVAGAIGVAMLLYRRSVAKERERALQAEQARDAVAQRRVAEERLRIARELHDAVGHHVAVISVQAGVAQHLLASKPDAAAEALDRVQEAGARVLEELPVMLRVLRQGEDESTEPAVGLARLDELIASARVAGLAVEVDGTEERFDLASAADLAAYRVIQEALTNARKHGDGRASLSMSREGEDLRIEVRNHAPQVAPTGIESGFGLVGMRERVDAAGGSLAAGPEGDEFVVRVALPQRRADAKESTS